MEIKEILKSTKGKFFRATFERSTTSKSGLKGETSTRTFRTGVRKGVTGDGMSYNPDEKGLVILYCKKGFRAIKAAGIVSVKCGQINWKRDI